MPRGGKSATHKRLVLSESIGGEEHVASWTGPLVALGARLARYHRKNAEQQLVVAISVPKRDLAAVLIGSGWVLASEAPSLPSPLEVLKSAKPNDPLRLVNARQVVTGIFSTLDESEEPPRALISGSSWRVDAIRAIAQLPDLETPQKEIRPEPASIECMAGMHRTWDLRLALPAADLAIVGTLAWLDEEMEIFLAKEGDELPASSIRSVLMPKNDKAATWYARLYPSSRFAAQLPLPAGIQAVILDGNGAVSYLGEIEAPVVVCVLDRSVADESAAEMIAQLRNSRGEPVSVLTDLGWPVGPGIEALAFTVAL